MLGASDYHNLSREEYISRCEEMNLQALYNNTDDYLGNTVCVKLEVLYRHSDSGVVYYLCSSVDGGYTFMLRDCVEGVERLQEGDFFMAYGECTGDWTVTSNGNKFDVIGMNMFYYDLIERSSLEAPSDMARSAK